MGGGGQPMWIIKELIFLWFGHFPRKMWAGDQNPKTLRNFSLYKIKFLKSPSNDSKNTRGGVKAVWTFSNQKTDFFLGWLPLVVQD